MSELALLMATLPMPQDKSGALPNGPTTKPGAEPAEEAASIKLSGVTETNLKLKNATQKFNDLDAHVARKVKELGKGWSDGGDPILNEMLDAYREARATEIEKAVKSYKAVGVTVTENPKRLYRDEFPPALLPGLK